MTHPEIKIYVLAVSSSDAIFRVPCFNYSEVAMVEYYLKKESCAREIYYERKKTGPTNPELIRAAASFVYGDRPKHYRSNVSGKGNQYLITATARRILKPLHKKNSKELLMEQIRKG